MRSGMILVLAIGLAGCSGVQRTGKWPSLAPRVGEISPLVPRTPLGACSGCGADFAAAAAAGGGPAPPPAPVSQSVPADVAARLEAAAAAIAAVAAEVPRARAALLAARAAAAGSAADSNAGAALEIERSRFESLFVPLSVTEKDLDAIEDALAGKADAQAPTERVAALRRELGRLEAERRGVPD